MEPVGPIDLLRGARCYSNGGGNRFSTPATGDLCTVGPTRDDSAQSSLDGSQIAAGNVCTSMSFKTWQRQGLEVITTVDELMKPGKVRWRGSEVTGQLPAFQPDRSLVMTCGPKS